MFGRATITSGIGPHSSYFFSLHNYFSFIVVSVCVAFIFHFIITTLTLNPFLHYTFYRIVPVYLLQAYKHTSVDAPYTYISCDYAYRAGICTHYFHEHSLV